MVKTGFAANNGKEGPIRILLVEDDPEDALLFQDALQSEGKTSFRVERAARLDEAAEKLSERNYEIIVLDLGLPDSKGMETVEGIKPHSGETPILVLSGADDDAVALASVERGAQDYIVKSDLRPSILRRTIFHAMERQKLLLELERRAQDLVRSESRIRRVIEVDPDGVIVIGRDGPIRLANPAAAILFGRPAEELRGAPLGLPASEEEAAEVHILQPEGRQLTVEMRVAGMDWEGEPAHLATLRDITERKRLEAELEETRQRQIRMRDDFLSHVSHELRSPLAAIHQFATILADGLGGEISETQADYLGIIVRNTNQLRDMIEVLLFVTRSDSGKLNIEPQILLAPDLIRKTIESVRGKAEEKGIDLDLSIAKDLPPIAADPERFRQILTNLVDNAVKFTPEGGRVEVHAGAADDSDEFLLVSVKDTGRGISEEGVKKIFDRLHQETTEIDIGRQGLGLGLFICKELVTRQGGEIRVESTLGKGATFSFTLPFFSVARQILPAFRPIVAERKRLSLLAIEMSLAEDAVSRRLGETTVREIRRIVRGSIIPNRDILLPRFAGNKQREVLFLLAAADEKGAGAIRKRIEEELKSSAVPQKKEVRIGMDVDVFLRPKGEEGEALEKVACAVGNRILDRMETFHAPA